MNKQDDEKKSIAASIICFNPEIERLKKAIISLKMQVDNIIIIDNASDNINEIEEIFRNENEIYLEKNKKNKGIAYALNQAVNYAIKNRFEWLLTMDQDSIIPSNLIEEYLKVIVSEKKIGILTLQVKKNCNDKVICEQSYSRVERCITSGSLMNLNAVEKVGRFDESMFIDWVDHDICKRLILSEFQIIRCNNLILEHELGPQETIYITEIFSKLFGTRVIRKPYSALRTYYYIRNGIYYYRKFYNQMEYSEKKFTKHEIAMSIKRGVLLGKNKIEYIKAVIKGVKDGKNMPLQK